MECYCPKCDLRLAIGQPHKCPAPKEEEVSIHTGGVRTDVERPPHIIGPAPILDGQPRVDGKLFTARTAERRALAREAYMAALGATSRYYLPQGRIQADFRRHPDTTVLPVRLVKLGDVG